jgi:catechol 2,3-dioxygenase-like lactoylglutathione lyase family enzyme
MDYRLEVVGIPVSDVDASKTFYSDVVGFGVASDPDGNGWSLQEFKR